ncbi:MAG: HAD family hydrolase, partial [Tabrizicola sp.]
MRCVVFDLDGTLADTSADLLAAANACFPSAVLGPEDALTAFHGGRAMLRLGFSRLGRAWSEADVDAGYPVLLEAYRAGIATHTRLYPGAMEAVEALKGAGFAVSVCTNKPEGLAELLLTELG